MPPGKWTFITNHGLVLSYIYRNPRSTAREIANHVGITERTIHKIIADLEAAGYIERFRSGRRNMYRVEPSLPLRHRTMQDISVVELLEVIASRENRPPMADSPEAEAGPPPTGAAPGTTAGCVGTQA